jgi:hypothetical protein
LKIFAQFHRSFQLSIQHQNTSTFPTLAPQENSSPQDSQIIYRVVVSLRFQWKVLRSLFSGAKMNALFVSL